MKNVTALILAIFLFSCEGKAQEKKTSKKSYAIEKSDFEWKSQLPSLSLSLIHI